MKLLLTVDRVDSPVEIPAFVVYDLETQEQTRIAYQPKLDDSSALNSGRNTFRPFGMCKNNGFVYVASNSKLGKFNATDNTFCGLIDVKMFVNTHQIIYDGETIYTTNAANDSLSIFDGKATEFFSFQSLRKTTSIPHTNSAYEFDRKHINSVVVHDGLLYVVAHRDTQYGSAAYCIDPKTWVVVKRIPLGVDCHGVQIVENSLYTLSTGTGTLFETSLSEDKVTNHFIVDPNAFFLRGLQQHGDKLYFVASTNFHATEGSNGCYLYVFDLVKKQIETKIDLAPIVVVNDILITE
jgi:hypothetical protein